MTEILSADEMEALLAERREHPGGATSGARAHVPFSFDGAPPFPGHAIERLAELGTRLAEECGRRLEAELRKESRVVAGRIESTGSGDAARRFAEGLRLSLAEPGGRRIADVVLENETVLALVEARLGGSDAGTQPRRLPTPVEISLVMRLVKICFGPAVASAFGSGQVPAASPLECRATGTDTEGGAGFAWLQLQLTVGGRGGAAGILLPAARAAELAAPAPATARSKGQAIPLQKLLAASVRVVPRVPGGVITLGDLMALQPGHVVRLDHPETEPIEIVCNGTPVVHGRLIRAGAIPAVEVVGWIADKESKEELR